MNVKVSVGIPAYNEEQNISCLLESILEQELLPECILNEIVISDDSTDSTPTIIKEYASKYKIIKYMHHNSRNGTYYALNEIFKEQTSDILVIIAADSIMDKNAIRNLTIPFLEEKVGLVAGNPVPVSESHNIVTRASKFSASILRQLRKDRRRNILIGRLFAISSSLLDGLELPKGTVAEEPYIVERCLDRKMKIKYADNAMCYYSPPLSLRDFIVQNRRSLEGQKSIIRIGNLKRKLIHDSTHVDLSLLSAFLKCTLRSPIDSICWVLLKVIENSRSAKYTNISPQWDISYSTKKVTLTRK